MRSAVLGPTLGRRQEKRAKAETSAEVDAQLKQLEAQAAARAHEQVDHQHDVVGRVAPRGQAAALHGAGMVNFSEFSAITFNFK